MGVKSTQTLTRNEAEIKFIELFSQIIAKDLSSDLLKLTNQELSDALDQMSDSVAREIYGWESGFDNYIVEDNKVEEKSNEN
jgi:hypothetical protein